MPEGHTLHRLARLHQRRFGTCAGASSTSPQGRFADAAAAVGGRVLRKADAYGKHLFHHYEGGAVVHVHLGLYGTFTELSGAHARTRSVRCGCGWSARSTAPTCVARRCAR